MKDSKIAGQKFLVVDFTPFKESPRVDETQEAIEAALNAKLEKAKKPALNQQQLNESTLAAINSRGHILTFDGSVEASALKVTCYVQSHGKKVAIIDCQGLFNIGYSEECGFNIENAYVTFPQDILECASHIERLSKEVDFIMLDNAHTFFNFHILTKKQIESRSAAFQSALQSAALAGCTVMGTVYGLIPPKPKAT